MQQLISLIKQQQQKQLSDQQIGIIVDFLYQLDYFHHLAQQYGKFYLTFLVQNNFIDIYNLRENRPLIDNKNLYILISGSINKHGFKNGSEIIIQRDGHIHTLKDSIFLKISIDKMNLEPKLKQLQKSINKNRFIIETKINECQHKQQLLRKFMKIQIFKKLAKYDLLQLVQGCSYKILFNGKKSHQVQKQVESIIYIVEGEIKLSFPLSFQSNPTKIDQFLKRYLVEKSKSNKKEITTNLTANQWIGIDEHYQKIPYKSSGIITSVQAQFLYIPVSLFDKLFNQKCNFTLFTKIDYMRNIKAEMLQKSFQTQIQKQSQILRWSQEQNPISLQFRRKLSKYHVGQQLGENMMNPEYDTLIKSRKKIISLKPKKHTNLSNFTSSQNETKSNFKNSLPVSLNKLQQKLSKRVNLFPQQYSKQFILPSQKREIDEAQAKKKINLMMYLQPKHHRKACQNKHNHSVKDTNFQKKLYSMAKKVTQNFALCSTFYRGHFNKGDQFSNLNLQTIISIQPSKKELLLNQKNEKHREILERQKKLQSSNRFLLPGLKTKSTIKNFQPISPRKNTPLDLSQHLLDQKYHIQSENTLVSKHKQSSMTISLRNDSSRTVDFRNHSKTLFVKNQNLKDSKINRTIDSSSMSKKRQIKKQPSFLNIL